MSNDAKPPAKRPHLLGCYDFWIARAEAEGTAAGHARAAQRRKELARLEAALAGPAKIIWIGTPPDDLVPITREEFEAMTAPKF